VDLAPEVVGDEVSRDHEEDVDPDVASGDGTEVRVIEDDGEDRDGTEPLDVFAERPPLPAF
jgi:hypothetical protein